MAPLVLLGTPDQEITRAESDLARSLKPGSTVLHLSGALSSALLARCRERGAHVGSMHPLQSFADPKAALAIVSGSVFACEGDDSAVSTAFTLAKAVGGLPIRIETLAKPIYHAAATAASNFLIAPILLALDLMDHAQIDRENALKALTPLILGTAKNAAALGVPQALTGPIERGDRLVVEGHMKAIEAKCPSLLPKYVALARLTVEAARLKGTLHRGDVEALMKILSPSQ
jgi:predicted short-subunit dehydrogenase-like oxidoreductase (DUF2520 family)